MNATTARSGVFVTVNGHEYQAEGAPLGGVVVLFSSAPDNPDPELFLRDEEHGRWRADVLTEDCERVDEVTTRAEHLGHECQVTAIEADGTVGLYYLGPDKARAGRDGFVQVETGVWAKTVNIYELGSLWEHHTDLLFADWLATRTTATQ